MGFTYKPSDEYIAKLNRLGDDDKLYRGIAKACAKPLQAALKKNLEPYRDTGQLIKSIKGKVIKNKTDGSYFVRAIATGYRKSEDGKKAVSNNQALIMVEYGISKGKRRRAPRPVLKKSEREATEASIKGMQEAIDKRMKELGL